MGWTWREENLDLILVPFGLLIIFSYHIIFLYRCLKHPQTTVIGYENHNKSAWVEKMMQIEAKDRSLAVSVLSSNISAASSLSTTSLALSSLIGAWLANSSRNIFTSAVIYGDTSHSTVSIKYIALLTCFLVAFASFVQATRHYAQATFLISMPNTDIPVNCVKKAVIRGGNFWSVGMRALYFTTTLILWIFGPIPMLVSSVIMVGILHKLDTNSSPLIQFRPHKKTDVFKKIGQELSAIAGALDHHEDLSSGATTSF